MSESAVDRVLVEIERIIREEGLRVGDGLPTENDIARQLGTSRNTVREAMRTLKAYGIIDARPRLGAVLADNRQMILMKLFAFGLEISEEVFRDIQGFRRLVEQGIVDQIIDRTTIEDIELLNDINDRMAKATDINDAALLDFEFHFQIVSQSGIRTAADIYSVLKPIIVRLLESGKKKREDRRDIAAEHRNIIHALEQRDAIGYIYHVREHLVSGLKYVRRRPLA
ncbi:FadR/GntR family transcriptional regulator [Bosea sp. (in: a-proteobacteria)]|uniref:FadR/GntR family transcriptional regulator n=1 Tax=Bosea sp. (in: a-proteobacteria) TaxID=1871050 RepID=UPI0026220488|nr:FCD domain-containing protein [Bosea sp. (in: a-proteobacteria)]MCO5090342.1 FCD domain-containing protein [Bosea sp. (in: a-proteobacteria)]